MECHIWLVGTLEEVPAQQGCWGQLSRVLPARLHQLLWSQDSNPNLVTIPDFSFTSFVSSFGCKFSGWYVEAWLVLQGSRPAALIQSASLVSLAGCEHCKGLGGNVWGIQVIVLSPSCVVAAVGLDRGQALPITQAMSMCPSTTQKWKVCSSEAVHSTSH